MTAKTPRKRYPESLQAVLGNLFADTPLGLRMREAKIWLIWERAVGKTVASRAYPTQFRDGTLTVAATSSPWLQQLTFMKRDLVKAVNRECGEELVRDIFLTTAPPRKEPPPPRVPKRSKPAIPPEQRAAIAAEARDPELARIIDHLMELDGKPF